MDQKLTDFRKHALIGKDILGHKGFDFEIEVLAGMGNYIGREETTLASMLNGFRPEFDAHNKGTQPYRILSVDYFLKALYLAERSPEKLGNLDKEISVLPTLVSVTGDCEKSEFTRLRMEPR
jgi:[NiFe] hydrogenase diaphorase moiety large subunit